MSKLKRAESALLFLALLFLPTQLGKHFWPQFSYVYSLTIDYLSPTIYFWDLLVTGLLFVSLLQRKPVNKLAFNLFLLFILTNILSLFPLFGQSINFGAGLVRLEQIIIAGLFGVYLAGIDLVKQKFVIFYSLLLSIFFESMLALGQFLAGHTLGFWALGERAFTLSTPAIATFDFQGRLFLRPYATFPHPNVLAAFMLIGPFVLFLFFQKNSYKLKKSVLGLVVLLAASAIFISESRTTLVAGFLALIFLLKSKRIAPFSRKFLALGLFLIGVASPFLYTRFSSIFNFDNLTLLRREELMGVALNLFIKNPLLGVGINNFIPAAADQLLIGPSRFLQPVHNIFLLQLSETGLVGLLGLLGLIGLPIWMLIKRKSFQANFLITIWGIIIFLGLFDHYFLTLPQGYRLLFLIWGLSFGLFQDSSQDRIN